MGQTSGEKFRDDVIKRGGAGYFAGDLKASFMVFLTAP